MKKALKKEYENCKITVKNSFNQIRNVDTSVDNIEEISKMECFNFMFEEVKEIKVKEEKKEVKKDFEDYSYTELKNMFPDVDTKKIKSKKAFIEHLNG